jgi:hypothetical protein
MQNHKSFLETLAVLRRDMKTHPDIVPLASGKNGQDFLAAYKSYILFTNAVRGFYSTLKSAQGQDDSLEAFFEGINHLIDLRQQREIPTSGSAAPAAPNH